MKKLTILLVRVLGSWLGYGQHDIRLGLLPQLNINYSWNRNWNSNFSIESRQIVFDNRNTESLSTDYQYERTDLTLVLTRKTGVLSSVGGGYMLRFRASERVHRFLQQFALVQRFERIRLGHRFRTDQTLVPDEDWEFRLRYRLSVEQPLRGVSIEPGEWYLKLSNEVLLKQQGQDGELEDRIVATLGYYFSDQNKLESGLDYRGSGIFESTQDHQLWWTMKWYYTLK